MKNLILILFMIPSLAFCQTDLDSLRKEVLTIKAEQQNIKLNLAKHSKEFGLGVVVMIAGAAVLAASSSQEKLLIPGAILVSIGTVIQFDSHKWIGRAGKKRRIKA
jgi:hypothetical protein